MAVVDKNESHETAWLWLSAMVDTLEEQQICLENVLAINPANEQARKGLDSLNQKSAAQPKPAAPPASTAFNAPFPSFETPPPKPGRSLPRLGLSLRRFGHLVSGASGATAFDGGFDFPGGFSDSSDESLDWLTGGSTPPRLRLVGCSSGCARPTRSVRIPPAWIGHAYRCSGGVMEAAKRSNCPRPRNMMTGCKI